MNKKFLVIVIMMLLVIIFLMIFRGNLQPINNDEQKNQLPAKEENITRPSIKEDNGTFTIYTISGNDVVLKSSKTEATPNEVDILSYDAKNQFMVGQTQYFVIVRQYYESLGHILVNGTNGKIIYLDEFREVIKINNNEVFIFAAGDEYNSDYGLAIFSLDEEGNLTKQFSQEGFFEDIYKTEIDQNGNFEIKAKKPPATFNKIPYEMEEVVISYKEKKFTYYSKPKEAK